MSFKLTESKVTEINMDYGVKVGKLYGKYAADYLLYPACLGYTTSPSVRLVYSFSKLVDIMVSLGVYTETTATEEINDYIIGPSPRRNPNFALVVDDRVPAPPKPAKKAKPAPVAVSKDPLIPDPPAGYYRVTKGKAIKGDKCYWPYTSQAWDVINGLAGYDVASISCLVYRELPKAKAKPVKKVQAPPKPVKKAKPKAKMSWPRGYPRTKIPKGWERLTAGYAEKTDKMLYTDGTWNYISGCKGDKITSKWIVIRKIPKPVKPAVKAKPGPEQECTTKDGVVLVAQPTSVGSCDGCHFTSKQGCERLTKALGINHFCGSMFRADKQRIIWVKK